MKAPFRFFVTATDTGVGKTEVSCALLSLLRENGQNPAAFKPYESGVLQRPADAVRLWEAAGKVDPLEHVVLHTFEDAVAPGVAAHRAGLNPPFETTLEGFRRFEGRALVMEGAGGLFVPLDDEHDVVDLIEKTRLPALVVARAGLGTLNHTILTLDALKARGIPVFAVVLVKSTPGEDVSERDNPEWIRRRRPGVRVLGPVPFIADESERQTALKKVLGELLLRTV